MPLTIFSMLGGRKDQLQRGRAMTGERSSLNYRVHHLMSRF